MDIPFYRSPATCISIESSTSIIMKIRAKTIIKNTVFPYLSAIPSEPSLAFPNCRKWIDLKFSMIPFGENQCSFLFFLFFIYFFSFTETIVLKILYFFSTKSAVIQITKKERSGIDPNRSQNHAFLLFLIESAIYPRLTASMIELIRRIITF